MVWHNKIFLFLELTSIIIISSGIANEKQENNVASQSELETIQLFADLFAPFSCLFDWKRCHLPKKNCFELQND